MISGILSDLFDSIELLEKNEESERVGKSHRRKRDSFMDRRRENRFVYSVCSSYEENDVWVAYFGFFDHFGKRFGGKNLGSYITIDNKSLLLAEKFQNPLAFFLTDECRIFGFLRFDVFDFDYSFQSTDIFLDRLTEMSKRIGNSDNRNHRTNGYKKILSLEQKDFYIILGDLCNI